MSAGIWISATSGAYRVPVRAPDARPPDETRRGGGRLGGVTTPGEVERTLRAQLRGEVDFGAAARALVTMDASNYRRVPLGVVAPRDADDVEAALRVCADAGVPVVPRGGGTSIAGQATGTGVVLDLTRHMNALLSVDPAARTAVVQPGLVLDRLRDAVRPHGLTFGPDPSTHSRCTLGGMIGNNACGAHSVAWGTTADNVTELAVTAYGGGSHRIGTGWAGAPDGLRELVTGHLGLLRTGMPPGFSRRISGYGGLDALLPERGVRLAHAFCGSEGTLGVVTEAVVRLVELPPAPALAVLGYADESAAADAAAGLLAYGPLTVEGMAEDLLGGPAGTGGAAAGRGRSTGGGAVGLPDGRAWLFVEMPDEGGARAVVRGADALDALVVTDPARQRALWRIREDAAGTATRTPDGRMAWPGWEDCAVPPARLGAYLRAFRALLAAHGLRGTPYGHFGEGCVHVRIDFDLASAAGVARYRTFSEELAELVVAHGGSLSGEHGDGQARAELLPKMYGEDVLRLFGAYKDVWDPAGGMNPGMLVRPARLDENLRFAVLPATPFAGEVARCVGVAKCRTGGPGGAGGSTGAGVMCPSYRVTGEEQHSTRGRARLLHEMLAGDVVTDGWRSPEVAEALDLCLGCKGCLSDCPVGVDMASYKSEFLHHHWAGRIRPLAHYTLGGLPGWLRLIARLRAAGAVNTAARLLPFPMPGLARERPLPALAKRPFTRDAAAVQGPGGGPVGAVAVTLWPDTFTEHLSPEVGHAALRVLRAAGLAVYVPRTRGRLCCGLTYLSTGRLDRARKVLRRTLDTLDTTGALGAPGEVPGPVTVLEPSCAAALRADLPALLPDDPRAARLAAAVRTVAETLEEYAPDWRPPRLDRAVVGQTHCHQHAVLGDAADRRLRERAGLVGEPAGGCCGLAGNFGFEPGHHEVSVACAEEQLLPSLRAAPPGALVQADGFSCRTQIAQLGGVRARHLVELLADGLTAPAGEGATDTQP
ncbi:FAD-binding and (Fe-S)-binding domain-containing protein [Streptomyces sp. NRRL F-4428]|uniref:FAD-binding and (Fe-S)-binding domain-containing protein n=1 Tax=Streptomyces sp. NRRL F-4428 TaxID=1609137 RepID=UPI00099D6FEC|nr:FAD-binding and (Fe-S)-binding domain-containing protein [Streptomyces sp. NRRL F-4428]